MRTLRFSKNRLLEFNGQPLGHLLMTIGSVPWLASWCLLLKTSERNLNDNLLVGKISKSVPHKHKDLNLSPRIYIKSQDWRCTLVILALTGSRDR